MNTTTVSRNTKALSLALDCGFDVGFSQGAKLAGDLRRSAEPQRETADGLMQKHAKSVGRQKPASVAIRSDLLTWTQVYVSRPERPDIANGAPVWGAVA